MRGTIVAGSALLLLSLLQVTVFPILLPTVFSPNPVLAGALTWGALVGYQRAVPFAVAGGFLIDLSSETTIGFNALLMGLVASLSILGESEIVPSNVLFPMALTFVGEIMLESVRLAAFAIGGKQIGPPEQFIPVMLLAAVASSLLVLPIFPVARSLGRRFLRPGYEW